MVLQQIICTIKIRRAPTRHDSIDFRPLVIKISKSAPHFVNNSYPTCHKPVFGLILFLFSIKNSNNPSRNNMVSKLGMPTLRRYGLFNNKFSI